MSEEKFKVGDLVVLNKKGIQVFPEVSDSDMPMRIDAIEDNVYKCLFKNKEMFLYLNVSCIESFHKENEDKLISCKEIEFAELTKQMFETFKKKNADYGDSTSQTFKEFGLTSYAIRLNDKLNRIKSFCKKGELEVNDESVIDTLKDMANYCLLAIIDIKNNDTGKKIEEKANTAFPHPKNEDTAFSMREKKRAYTKEHKAAFQDMKRHLDASAIYSKSFAVLDMYKWIDRMIKD
ncbi:DUF1599 domain-containing protein [Prevotella corporis]|uniref:DUF1599 domain-containing protein n=1 Tax=Prevotella corporis TaxID=28128 RepID=UPI0023F87B3D|nr:DUF1599 domain-containing protein [Prevotella corporis]